jgi:hypothetical protein
MHNLLKEISNLKETEYEQIRNLCKSKEYITYQNDIKEFLTFNGNLKLDLSRIDYNMELELIREFIEYWELHCDVRKYGDNLQGYTKIVNGQYVYKFCQELYENKSILKILSRNVQQIVIEKMMWDSFQKIKLLLEQESKIASIETNEERQCNFFLSDYEKRYIDYDNYVLNIKLKGDKRFYYIAHFDKNIDKISIYKKERKQLIKIRDYINFSKIFY